MRNRGFTLIELLVVIAVLGILAAVVLVAINPAERINSANDAKAKTHVNETATAIETCYTDQGVKNPGTGYANCNTNAELTTGGYVKTMPPNVTACASGTEVIGEACLSTGNTYKYNTATGTYTENTGPACVGVTC